MRKTALLLAVLATGVGCMAKPAPAPAAKPAPVAAANNAEAPPCARDANPIYDLTCDAVISFMINPLIAQRCTDQKGFFYYCDTDGKKYRHGDGAWSCDHLCRCYDGRDKKDGVFYDVATYVPTLRSCPRDETAAEVRHAEDAIAESIATVADKAKLPLRASNMDSTDSSILKDRDPANPVPPFPPPSDHTWGVVCHDDWTNQNCQNDDYAYQCTTDGELGFFTKSAYQCDANCGCVDMKNSNYHTSGGHSVSLKLGMIPRDESAGAQAQFTWALICNSGSANENCRNSSNSYDCDARSGELIRYGNYEDECEKQCGCQDLSGGRYVSGNGYSRDVSSGHGPPPGGRRKACDVPPSEQAPVVGSESDSSLSIKPHTANFAIVCDNLWAHNRCTREPHKYTCNTNGGLERFGERNSVCEEKCQCIDLDTNKLMKKPAGGSKFCEAPGGQCAISPESPKQPRDASLGAPRPHW